MFRIGVLDDYMNIAQEIADWDRLADRARVDFYRDHLTDRAALVERLRPYEVLVIMRERTPFPRELLALLPELKLLVSTSVRNKSVDLAACVEHGVLVCHTESGPTPTAEHTWALILGLAKNIAAEDRATREGQWGVKTGIGLSGKVLGVVGLGKLGSRVAQIGALFGMQVIAWSPNLTAARAAEIGVARVGKDELMSRADFISVHVVLSERSRALIGADDIARMKPGAYLVNTARGPIVDENALVKAVQSGAIAGAGLDVFATEPLPANDPLRTLPNSIITPHTGGFIRDNYELWYRGAVEDIEAWLNGKPIRMLTSNV
jgi:phosphoglycerate dehydrogenase-like enzyme